MTSAKAPKAPKITTIKLKDVLTAGYTLAPVEQNTPEWHAWRAEGLGGSSVACVLGENPFQTAYRLWAEKVGFIQPEDLSRNPNVLRGVNNEDAAREAWEVANNDFAVPVCAVNNYAPWLRVSYDGLTSDGRVLEIKCPSAKKLAWFKERWAEGVVAASYDALEELGFGYYYAQTQYQMVVVGACVTSLWIFNPDEQRGYEVIIPLNEEYAQNMLVEAEKFWQCIKTVTPPELDPKRDILHTSMLDDAERHAWVEAESNYISFDEKIKALELQVKELKDARDAYEGNLVKLAGIWPKVESEIGLKLTVFAKQGTVDYKAALAELAPHITDADLNRFRKAASTGVRITVPKA